MQNFPSFLLLLDEPGHLVVKFMPAPAAGFVEGTDYNRANGTDYKSAPAEQNTIICELGEAKSAPAM